MSKTAVDDKLYARNAKKVLLRMNDYQHTRLVRAADAAGVSLNTFLLQRLGFETPFEQHSIPRGPKSDKLTRS